MPRTAAVADALTKAAAIAGYAPSVHNTQPWRWTVLADRMELSAVRDRQLAAVDPDGRLLMISCGAALHHVRTALAAAGWECVVDRLPDPRRPDLLAVLVPTTHRTPDPAAMRLVQTIEMRHTDRRPLSDEALPDDVLAAVVEAVDAQGTRLHVLPADQVYDLAMAEERAGAAEQGDEATRQELAGWVGRGDGLGVPAYTLPDRAPQTTVPERDFGQQGTLPVTAGHDRAATYALVYGDGDEPLWWLRAGEALSAAWLTATRLGASLLPLSAAVEVPATRVALRRLIAQLGWPYLVVRLGIADAGHAGPVHAPRLATTQIVDTTEVRHLLDGA